MFEIFLSKEADKAYQKLPTPEKRKIDRVLSRLGTDPFSYSKRLQGEFSGLQATRAWPYRLTFTVDTKDKKVFIVVIAHRQQIYK
jgi:mRNA-degrading endonuclease RelE of RelBE toxin-antitoxin system